MNKCYKAIIIATLMIMSGYALQVSAAPIFTFTQYGGFETDNVPIAGYTNQVTGNAALIPSVPVYERMSWIDGSSPQSSLSLSTVTGPAGLLPDTWTNISTLTHNNIVIPSAVNWSGQDVTAQFRITDSDGATNVVLNDANTITLSFVETPNSTPCPAPNPNASICDDVYSFSAVGGFDDIPFFANDGSEWLAEFRLADLTNAIQIGPNVFTAENVTSTVGVETRVSQISQIPEPASIALLGLGLVGIGFAKRRKLNHTKT